MINWSERAHQARRQVYYHWALKPLERYLESHEVAKSFTGTGLSIDGSPLDGGLVTLTHDVMVDAEAIGRLFMLPDNSTATYKDTTGSTLTYAPPGVYLQSQHPWTLAGHTNSVGIYKTNPTSGIYIDAVYIDHMFMDKAKTPDKFGFVAFGLCALTAYRLGWSEITLLAGGCAPPIPSKWAIPDMVGYFVWPKFGFDAPLEPGETSGNPKLSHCKTVSDVMAADSDWWQNVGGNGRAMKFDLTPFSKSWKTLIYYAKTKVRMES
ncbi:hypothetical protein [Novimethylophilus kurashikiensis]|uniref:hypothetical protein n=1 Tax=Novimethylophilus kurashikiensis TaxID=1825523 RepID=UPI000D590A1E|nr:hypothetical protein [Novimethylophilus kurashikiensis]